jgi:pimeloyl-ACP methyl ester carboxylesterase
MRAAGLIFILFLSLYIPQSPGTAQKQVAGNWLGVLEVSGLKLRILLKITQAADGKLSAKFDSVDQGVKDLPIDSISAEDGVVKFVAPPLSLSFEGKLNDDGSEIAGQLKQGPTSFPVTFKRTEKPPTLERPQDPQKPYPYSEEEVSYENTADKVKLSGTLTLPSSKEKVPAVILITGSGPQDRNETIMGHRPFLVLSDHLTRHGIAVLRVDDRGMGGSSAGSPKATSANFAQDVLAGIAFLKGRTEIDSGKIGLIGHSEGGMIGPMVAAQSKDVAFVVMMAGMGQTGADVILAQGDLLQRAAGANPQTIVLIRKMFEKIFAILKTEKDNVIAEKNIREMVANETASLNETQKTTMEPVLRTINAQMVLYVSDWFRFFIGFDPGPTLARVHVPVLSIVGDKDLQVPPKENAALIEAALKKGGNKNFSVIILPGLNHLFQTAKTGLPTEYGQIEETISPAALNIMSDWIVKTTSPQKGAEDTKRKGI